MSDIVLLVLVQGEHVVGEVIDKTDDVIKLKNIVAFVPSPDGRITAVPYLPISDENEATFNIQQSVRHILKPNSEIVEYYTKEFGLLTVPEKKIVV